MTLRDRDQKDRGRPPRKGLGLLAAGAFCGAAAAIVIAASGTAQSQQQAPRVVVKTVGGTDVTVTLAEQDADVRGRAYVLRSQAGTNTVPVASGFSFEKVLDLADIDRSNFGYMQIARPGGGSVLLSRDQVLSDDAFPDGPPVFYELPGGAGIGFIRPSSGPDDFNANDSFSSATGVIYTAAKKGKLLDLEVSAKPTKTTRNKSIKFTARVTESGAGETVTFNWNFSDGRSDTGPVVTHAFKRAGSYNVVAEATTRGDDVTASASVRVQVGDPNAGPNRTGGGVNGDSPLDSGPSFGTGPSPIIGAAPPAPSAGAPAPEAKPEPAPSTATETGTLVEGRLLTSADGQPVNPADLPPASEDEAAGARSGDPESDDDGGGVPDIAIGLLATMGMLGCGGLIELRGARSLRTS